MKKYIKTCSALLFAAVVCGCGKDNYDAPESTLTGQITYQGQAIGVRSTGESVQLQLYQPGYEKKDAIAVFVAQDGTFSARLFDGYYVLRFRENNGPWVYNSNDSLAFTLKKSYHATLEVTPYFMLSNVALSLSGNACSATFVLNKIAEIDGNDVEWVRLVLNKTKFVDGANNVFSKDFDVAAEISVDASNSLSVSLSDDNLAELAKHPVLYARLGVKSKKTEQAIWSAVIQVK
jgi:hypothetical protein